MSLEATPSKAQFIQLYDASDAGKSLAFDTTGSSPRELGWVGPLAPVNVFVGANNCGKSRVMRQLFKNAQPENVFFGDDDLYSFAKEIVNRDGWISAIEASGQLGVRNAITKLQKTTETHSSHPLNLSSLKHIANDTKRFATQWITAHQKNPSVGNIVRSFRVPLEIAAAGASRSITRVYLPTGRTPLAFEQVWEPTDALGLAVAERYFPEVLGTSVERNGRMTTVYSTKRGNSHLITGQDFYSRMRDHLLGENDDRDMMATFQSYLGQHFFDGRPVTLIPKHSNNEHRLHIKIGAETERPAHLLGEGVSQAIIILFALFCFGDKNLMIFVEEPENYLHPGFQRLLMRAFAPSDIGGVPMRGGSRQVFLTTHSNHIIDSSMHSQGMSLFHVQKRQTSSDASPVTEVSPRLLGDRSVLVDLGAQPSSVFLANSSVWVEGITDRMYIQRIIEILAESRLPQNRPRPEVDYTIALFGGANLAHWSFAERDTNPGRVNAATLGATAIVVVDRDDTRPKKRVLDKMQELGDRLIVLPVREIENLITPHVLINTVAEVAGIAIESRTGVSQARYASKPIGQFIKNLLRGLTPPRKVVGSNGQILDKVEFARVAVSHTRSIQDLSPQAVWLGERLLKHVDAANGRLIRPQ